MQPASETKAGYKQNEMEACEEQSDVLPPPKKHNNWTHIRRMTAAEQASFHAAAAAFNPSLKALTTDFLGSTSAHGIPRVVNSKTWYRKAIWIFMFLVALTYFLYQCTTLFTTYYAYPTSIKNEVITR